MQRVFLIIQKQRVMEVQNKYFLSLQNEYISNCKDWSVQKYGSVWCDVVQYVGKTNVLEVIISPERWSARVFETLRVSTDLLGVISQSTIIRAHSGFGQTELSLRA
jgi:hypothetical protein